MVLKLKISNHGIWVGNPIGWILQNVNSSFALYKDNGIRSFEKVVLALRPRPLIALVYCHLLIKLI